MSSLTVVTLPGGSDLQVGGLDEVVAVCRAGFGGWRPDADRAWWGAEPDRAGWTRYLVRNGSAPAPT